MRVLKGLLIGSLLFIPASAFAQNAPAGSATPDLGVDMAQAAAPAPAARPAAAATGDRVIMPRLQAGLLFNNSQAGVIFGGGVGAKPFHTDMWELVGDVNFVRINGLNSWNGSGDVQYDFPRAGHNMRPFAGGGLAISRSTVAGVGSTNANLQILGGAAFPMATHDSTFRAEGRIIFTTGHLTTILLAGISF
jgi:hypothetical protein